MAGPNDPVRLTAGAAKFVASGAGFAKKISREGVNRTGNGRGLPPAGVDDRPTWPMKITGLPPLGSSPPNGGLYTAKLLTLYYDGTAAGIEFDPAADVPEVFVAPLPGQTFEVDDTGFGSLVGEWRGVGVFALGGSSGAAAPAGFYARLSGSSSPYSFVEVDGPDQGADDVTDGRTGTSNATELLSGLALIPTGMVVWLTPAGSGYVFHCDKDEVPQSWRINEGAPGDPCTITILTTKTRYVSAPNLTTKLV